MLCVVKIHGTELILLRPGVIKQQKTETQTSSYIQT